MLYYYLLENKKTLNIKKLLSQKHLPQFDTTSLAPRHWTQFGCWVRKVL